MSPPEIHPETQNIPAGWPRPFYRDPTTGRPRYAQWTSASAAAQITHCHDDRTYTAGKRFACSSCAQVMERGLLLADIDDPYSGQVGSPICFRCCVFAYTHCPEFTAHADEWTWHMVRAPADYREVDETGCLEPTSRGARRRRVTRNWVEAEVRAGRLWLTDTNAADTPLLRRTPNR